jgi:hypothetical protein
MARPPSMLAEASVSELK